MVGFQDAFDLEENFPNASYAVLNGAGYNLQIEKPILFDAYLEDWLYRMEASKI